MDALTAGHAAPTGTPATAGLDALGPAFHNPATQARLRLLLADCPTPDIAGRLGQLGQDLCAAVELSDGRRVVVVDRFALHGACWRVVEGRVHLDRRADVLGRLPPEAPLSLQALFDYLYFHVIPSPRTVFEGVHRIPPGHCLVIDGGTPQLQAWWRPRFEEPRDGPVDRLAEEFRTLVAQAVRRQLDGTLPACFLSGGTDSSTVAGMIGQVTGTPAETFSIGFEAEGYDEMAFARIAAQRFGCSHHAYYVTPGDLVGAMAGVAGHYDQPFGNSSVLPAYLCAMRAREQGVSRLLAGDGGDELFGGNARYAKQRVFGWYEGVPAPLRQGLMEPLLNGTPLGRLPLARKARSYVEQARVPLPARMEQYNLLLRLGTAKVLTPAFLAQVDTGAPLTHQQTVWASAVAAHPLNRMLAFDWRYTLAEADLPKVTGSTSLAGVGVGFPFLDADLLNFSLRLPPEFKVKGLKLRWFFKEALKDFLPQEILTKRKQGFGLPFGVWAVKDPALKGLAADALRQLGERGIVAPGFIRTLLDTHLPAHPGYYGEMVWILTMLELWLRRHRAGFALPGR